MFSQLGPQQREKEHKDKSFKHPYVQDKKIRILLSRVLANHFSHIFPSAVESSPHGREWSATASELLGVISPTGPLVHRMAWLHVYKHKRGADV